MHPRFTTLVRGELDALVPAGTQRLVLDPAADVALTASHLPAGPVLLAIGPEGGWIPEELETLANHEFEVCRLGPRILRIDVACLTAMGAMLSRL